jgi:vancomycin permeability regulator SanA
MKKTLLSSLILLGSLAFAKDATDLEDATPPQLQSQSMQHIPANDNNYQNQKWQIENEINKITTAAMYYYSNGGDLKKIEKEFFQGITLKGNYELLSGAFSKALELDNSRLSLHFAKASAEILQRNIPVALEYYQNIAKLDPDNFEGYLHLAYFADVSKEQDLFENSVKNLLRIDQARANRFIQKFHQIQNIIQIPLETTVQANSVDTIILLGYALANNGEMQPTLIDRLKQAYDALLANPDASIIVSGGVPKQGVTESYLMKQWLVAHGIDSARIVIEDKSHDTVENAIFSIDLLQTLDYEVKNVLLISSASHMRRAQVIFQEIATQNNLDLKWSNLVALDYPNLEQAHIVTTNEKLVIYRDFLRAADFWQFPGLKR